MKVFPVFWNFSKCRPYRVHWALFSEKIAWKQVQNLCGDFQDCFWTLLRIQFFFDFFFQVLQISIYRLHWARKIRKNYLKQVWTILITFFGILNFLSLFDSCGFFWVSRVHWAELFSVEIIKQNMLKQCFWERFWRNFKVSQFFHFFVFFEIFDHPGCTGQKFFSKKNTSKHVQNMFDCFWERFLGILKNWKFFVFWSFSKFRLTRLHWAFFSERITSKQFQNLFGHFQEHFWTLLKFQIVFDFFSNFSKFRPSRVHWALFFREKPQNKFKTCLDTFGNVFGYLEFWEVFAFLWNFSTSLSSRVHWPKNFEKITSKHVWTILETFLDIFENLNSFPFLWKFFESPGCTGQRVFPSKKSSKTCLNNVFGNVLGDFSTTQGALGRNFCRKNYLEACWRHVWLPLGTFFQAFWTIESFSSFLKFFQVSTLQGKLVIFLTKKTTSEHIENFFEHFWERFW